MKVSLALCALVFSLCQSATITNKQLTEEERRLKQFSDLYEIDILSRPEDGQIQGLRLRRSGKEGGVPEIDIEDTHDGAISVNGIRIKRSDLSDVEFDSEVAGSDPEDSEAANSDRTRRSGDLFGFFGQVFSKKLSSLAAASSGHNAESDLSYGPPVTSYHTKSFDIWAFKKAILATLLQAVKAIKGGVIALGGQIIKAKGHLITTKGKIVAHKGESISEFGRNIAANALLQPQHSGPATAFGSAAIDHHVPETISAGYPAAIVSSSYGVPPAPTYTGGISAYGPPAISHGYAKRGAQSQQFGSPQELPNGVQAGLLLLKPIRVPTGQTTSQSTQQGSNQSYGNKRSSFTNSRDSATAQSQQQEEIIEEEPVSAEERSFYYY